MSKDLLVHLAEENYWVVGFSSPEALKGLPTIQKGSRITQEPGIAWSLVGQAKQAMGYPPRRLS